MPASSSALPSHGFFLGHFPIPSALPVKRVLNYLQWMAHCKSLLLFVTTYVLFAHINSRRMDWQTGRMTLQWLQEAHERVGLKPFDRLDTITDVAGMLRNGVPRVVTALSLLSLKLECREHRRPPLSQMHRQQSPSRLQAPS